MDVLDFNSLINQLLHKISKEQKQIFLLGDFNINLLNYNEHQTTNEFLDSLASNTIISYILQPTRLTSHSKILIYNLFFKCIFMWSNIRKHYCNHIWSSNPVFACVQCAFKSFMQWIEYPGKRLVKIQKRKF